LWILEICAGYEVYARIENIACQNIAYRYGSLYSQSLDSLHAVKKAGLGYRAAGPDGKPASSLYGYGRCEHSSGIPEFALEVVLTVAAKAALHDQACFRFDYDRLAALGTYNAGEFLFRGNQFSPPGLLDS
jgi:hypothetical protein